MEKYKLDNEQIVAKKHKQLQEANKRAERVIEAVSIGLSKNLAVCVEATSRVFSLIIKLMCLSQENEVKQLQITVEKLTVSLETSNKELVLVLEIADLCCWK